MALTPLIIGDFYFEIRKIDNVIRVGGFITPNKPNLTTKSFLTGDEIIKRTTRLEKLFSDLGRLPDYKVETEPVGMLLAQETSVDVPGIRANISRRDEAAITMEEVNELINKQLQM